MKLFDRDIFGGSGAMSKKNKDFAAYAGAAVVAAAILVFAPKIFIIASLFLLLGYLLKDPKKAEAKLQGFLPK